MRACQEGPKSSFKGSSSAQRKEGQEEATSGRLRRKPCAFKGVLVPLDSSYSITDVNDATAIYVINWHIYMTFKGLKR